MTTSQIISTALASIFLLTLIWLLAKAYKTKLVDNPMTPFSIVKGGVWFPFNYRKHLTKKVDTGEQLDRLILMSDKWNTCPCGNLPQCIQRDKEGMPVDAELAMYGNDFSFKARELRGKRYGELSVAQEELIALLRKIELRGKVLARQEIAKHNELHILKLRSSRTW